MNLICGALAVLTGVASGVTAYAIEKPADVRCTYSIKLAGLFGEAPRSGEIPTIAELSDTGFNWMGETIKMNKGEISFLVQAQPMPNVDGAMGLRVIVDNVEGGRGYSSSSSPLILMPKDVSSRRGPFISEAHGLLGSYLFEVVCQERDTKEPKR